MSAIGPFKDPIPIDLLKKIAEVAPKVEIRDIRLVHLSCTLAADSASPSALELTAEHGIETAVVQGATFLVRVRFTLRGRTAESAQDSFSVTAVFQLTYEASELESIPAEGLAVFAATNGVHNAWPYWRELAQNVIVRMGLPALTLPLLKISSMSETVTSTKTATDASAIQPSAADS